MNVIQEIAMLRMLIFFFLIFYNQISFSKIVVIGKICGGSISIGSNVKTLDQTNKNTFPLQSYEVDPFFICNLKYHSTTSQAERKWDLTTYKMISATGILSLEVNDKKNYYYRYNLSLQPINISNNVLNGVAKIKKIKGRITFNKNEKNLGLEGYYQLAKGKLEIRNIIKEDSNYKLTLDGIDKIALIRLQDFPVWVEFK